MHAKRLILSFILLLSVSPKVFCDIERKNPNHAGLGMVKSLGLSDGKSPVFSPSAYWYFYGSDGWRSSIALEKRYSTSDILTRSLFVFTQGFIREHRLWADVYWGAGFELMFLYPTLNGRNPIQKDPIRKNEFGVGANLHLLEHFTSEKTLEIKLSKWRGVGSKNYQGFTFALIFSHSIEGREEK